MNNPFEKRLLFCFFIYVLIFIGAALFAQTYDFVFSFGVSGRMSIIETLYKSNLFIPFAINTFLLFYYAVKAIF